jgi:hypothetical protein
MSYDMGDEHKGWAHFEPPSMSYSVTPRRPLPTPMVTLTFAVDAYQAAVLLALHDLLMRPSTADHHDYSIVTLDYFEAILSEMQDALPDLVDQSVGETGPYADEGDLLPITRVILADERERRMRPLADEPE